MEKMGSRILAVLYIKMISHLFTKNILAILYIYGNFDYLK